MCTSASSSSVRCGMYGRLRRIAWCRRKILTPISIKKNPFLKLILLEQTPLLTCFGFVTRKKWLVSRRINLRKALFLIDVGVKISQPSRRRVSWDTASIVVELFRIEAVSVEPQELCSVNNPLLHFELDASSLQSDVIRSIKVLFLLCTRDGGKSS